MTEPRLIRELAGAPETHASGTGAPAATGTDVGPAELRPLAAPFAQAGQPGETRPAVAVAGLGRGVVTLCATALSLFR